MVASLPLLKVAALLFQCIPPCAVNTVWLSQLLFQLLTCSVLQHAASEPQTHCHGMLQPYARKWKEETHFWCLCIDTLEVKWKAFFIFKFWATSIFFFFFVISLSAFLTFPLLPRVARQQEPGVHPHGVPLWVLQSRCGSAGSPSLKAVTIFLGTQHGYYARLVPGSRKRYAIQWVSSLKRSHSQHEPLLHAKEAGKPRVPLLCGGLSAALSCSLQALLHNLWRCPRSLFLKDPK